MLLSSLPPPFDIFRKRYSFHHFFFPLIPQIFSFVIKSKRFPLPPPTLFLFAPTGFPLPHFSPSILQRYCVKILICKGLLLYGSLTAFLLGGFYAIPSIPLFPQKHAGYLDTLFSLRFSFPCRFICNLFLFSSLYHHSLKIGLELGFSFPRSL